MNEFAVKILLALSSFLGVTDVPLDSGDWVIRQNWQRKGMYQTFAAENQSVSKVCNRNTGGILEFPQVVHGVHAIYAADRLIGITGDPTFRIASAFYNRGYISCDLIQTGEIIRWEIDSYTKYFSRFNYYPVVREKPSIGYYIDQTLNVFCVGSLFVMMFFSLILYINRIPLDQVLALAFGGFFFSGYTMFCVAPYFGIPFSMLVSHKIADVSAWFGISCYFYCFYSSGFLSKWIFRSFLFTEVIGILVILSGQTGDVIQVGTNIPMPIALLCCIDQIRRSFQHLDSSQKWTLRVLNTAISSILFSTAAINEIVNVLGIGTSYMLVSIGSVAGIFFLASSVNQRIEDTYFERDTLLHNLESMVAEKTKSLSDALATLKSTQAELVDSARLASLGTLSAGIAHEINNSMNFVYGALYPLEKKLTKLLSPEDKASVDRSLNSIKEGTKLTIEIVKSLRNYTGLNEAKFKEVNLREAVASVLTILRTRVRDVEVNVDISEDAVIDGNLVGINQIFMNLITNAIDAFPNGKGKITIRAQLRGDVVEICVCDNGSGIPPEIQKRIFDPFFTTKEVGKGTGLGLHIVQKEVERHRGKIRLESHLATLEPRTDSDFPHGTSFYISIPRHAIEFTSDVEQGRAA